MSLKFIVNDNENKMAHNKSATELWLFGYGTLVITYFPDVSCFFLLLHLKKIQYPYATELTK